MSQPIDVSVLTGKQIADLIDSGHLSLGSNGAKSNGRKSNGQVKTDEAAILSEMVAGAYDVWEKDRDRFITLHPVLKHGFKGAAATLRGKANVALVVGECPLTSEEYKLAIGKTFNKGMEAKDVRRNGKIISTFYSARVTKAGEVDKRAGQVIQDGGRIRLDRVNKTLSVELPDGYEVDTNTLAALHSVVG